MFSFLLPIIYLAFISLGLPDALLGSAWPTMYPELGVPISYAGIISMIICFGTIVSSLQSDRLTFRFGTGKITAISVAMTAVALYGFSISNSFIGLCLWSIPYGLGAGSVDASLNNYVALHYESRHMSWLHCMWGTGATLGPYVMGFVLSGGHGWNLGYRIISILQVVLTAVLIFSLPQWKGRDGERKQETGQDEDGKLGNILETHSFKEKAEDKKENLKEKPLSFKEILAIPGAKPIMICFFCYCALEQTAGLWAASYLNLHKGIDSETAATFASLFFLGITVGRAVSGFVTMKLNDTQMIYLGQGIIGIGILAMLIPGPDWLALGGLIVIGLGCAPIYPCIIHSTPDRFGADKSQAMIGVQMASAYIGPLTMPPLFGLIANHMSVSLLPMFLMIILGLMTAMFYLLNRGIPTRV